jgi:hypothetical protein
MAIVGGVAEGVFGVPRKALVVPAAEVVPGDVVRDQGIFKHVAGVAPLVSQLSLLLSFEPTEGFTSDMSVPLSASVSVWRVCGVR